MILSENRFPLSGSGSQARLPFARRGANGRRLATATRDATETLPGIPGWDAPFWVTRFGRNRNEVLSNAARCVGSRHGDARNPRTAKTL